MFFMLCFFFRNKKDQVIGLITTLSFWPDIIFLPFFWSCKKHHSNFIILYLQDVLYWLSIILFLSRYPLLWHQKFELALLTALLKNKILKFSFLPHLAINFIPTEIIRKPWFFESPVTCECLKIIYTTKNFLTGYKIVSSCQLISMENLSLISQVNLRLLSNSSFCFLETS